ncbi:TraR/DksA C4-type zinc finger protein [Arsenophonus apicola]|uniref:TraR/DksA C4-type zinc finger protein n=1 Tax=Arsenophonus apicola TaxID=2879119 RepID=A0ABY8P761_9GAMM|nr:TraR/DksA C4-type zinc finger protein [Arsenophonus apicola]WGO84695.1 TraR/DksA C4-type zinc finger protein [Arsenophonus apicola]
MSREIDRACEYETQMREHQINVLVKRQIGVSAFECQQCNNPIPEKRRIASPGCIRCIDCQTLIELKDKHYRSV